MTETQKAIEQEAEEALQGFEYRGSLEEFAKRAYIAGRSKADEVAEARTKYYEDKIETLNRIGEESLLLYRNMVNTISEKDKEIRLLEERDVLWQNKHELLNDRIRELEEALREFRPENIPSWITYFDIWAKAQTILNKKS